MRRPAGDVGTATAELAVAVPAVSVLLAAVVAVAQASAAQLEVVDAARAGARAAARGDDLGRVRSVAGDAATGRRGGGPAAVDVAASGATVRVTVSRRVRLVLRRGPSVRVSASAVAMRETGSATVLVLAVVILTVVLTTLVAGIGAVAVSRHRAASAADLGALAAADVLVGRASGSPCAAAATVVAAAGAALATCRTDGRTADVVATVRPPGLAGRLGRVRVRARAGPHHGSGAAVIGLSRHVPVSRCGCRSGRTRMALPRALGQVRMPVIQVARSGAAPAWLSPNGSEQRRMSPNNCGSQRVGSRSDKARASWAFQRRCPSLQALSAQTRAGRGETPHDHGRTTWFAAVERSRPLRARVSSWPVVARRRPDGAGIRAKVDVRALIPDERPVRTVVRRLGPAGSASA